MHVAAKKPRSGGAFFSRTAVSDPAVQPCSGGMWAKRSRMGFRGTVAWTLNHVEQGEVSPNDRL
jgi:hypothetical protein